VRDRSGASGISKAVKGRCCAHCWTRAGQSARCAQALGVAGQCARRDGSAIRRGSNDAGSDAHRWRWRRKFGVVLIPARRVGQGNRGANDAPAVAAGTAVCGDHCSGSRKPMESEILATRWRVHGCSERRIGCFELAMQERCYWMKSARCRADAGKILRVLEDRKLRGWEQKRNSMDVRVLRQPKRNRGGRSSGSCGGSLLSIVRCFTLTCPCASTRRDFMHAAHLLATWVIFRSPPSSSHFAMLQYWRRHMVLSPRYGQCAAISCKERASFCYDGGEQGETRPQGTRFIAEVHSVGEIFVQEQATLSSRALRRMVFPLVNG